MPTATSTVQESTDLVNNLETHYFTGGPPDAPVVVFLHDGAYGGAADVTWGKILPKAAEKFRVIAPDFLGYGGSAKSIRVDVSPFEFRIRHIFALLDHLGVNQPVHLVGNSFGGSMGLRALSNPVHRDRIATATTINGTGGPWRSPEMAKLGAFDGTRESLDAIIDLLVDDYDAREEDTVARMHWATRPGHFMTMRAPHMEVPAALKVERPADPYPTNLNDVTQPVLLVQGTKDVLLESDWPSHLEEAIPNAETTRLPYMHSPNITHPDEVWAVIDEFLTRAQGAR